MQLAPLRVGFTTARTIAKVKRDVLNRELALEVLQEQSEATFKGLQADLEGSTTDAEKKRSLTATSLTATTSKSRGAIGRKKVQTAKALGLSSKVGLYTS
jgi:hypothetical protein